MMKQLAMVMFLMVGCGDSQSAAEEPDAAMPDDAGSDDGGGGGTVGTWYKSGTRIKMSVLSTPDGAKQFQGWNDTSRNETCRFVFASDGAMRCLPADSAPHVGTYFSDNACTVPAVIVYTCATAPKYIEVQTAGVTCGVNTAMTYGPVYERGAQLTTIYQRGASTCTATPVSAPYTAYAVGAQVPIADFQSASTAVE